MRTKNLTPFPFGCKVCSRKPPQPEMTVVVRGAFAIEPGRPLEPFEAADQGAMTSEVFHEDDADRLGECLHPNDFADFKPQTDLLLKGTCHTPRGKPKQACPVTFRVGRWSKGVLVIGNRTWDRGLISSSMSDPEPFTQMPLTYANSFGGEGFAANPVGKGYRNDDAPNVEYRDRPIRSARDRPPPAAFGPINPAWPPRAKKVGKKYGDDWKKKRSPFYSEDFDWTYFNLAPEDQQLPGYLKGDEPVAFTHLHPDASELKVRLPALRLRVFTKDVAGRFREVRMNLDTLFADLDDRRLHLYWRGLVPIADHDMLDVSVMLIASEPLAEVPRPVTDYRSMLDAFEKDPLGMDDQPQDVKAAQAALEVLQAGDDAADAGQPPLDKISKLIGALGGGLEPDLAAKAQQGVTRIGNAAKALDVDLDGPLKRAMAAKAGPPPVVGGKPNVRLGEALGKISAMANQLRKTAEQSGVRIAGLDKLDAVLNDPRLKQIDPTLRIPDAADDAADDAEPGPGGHFAGRNLRGRDLKGVDLRNANLEGADLSEADLTGAKLSRANLKYAHLVDAKLGGTDLTEADLTMVDAQRVEAEEVVFARANLDRANFAEARLGRAELSGASMKQTILDRANIVGATFTGASLSEVVMSQVEGGQVDLGGATLNQVVFDRADLTDGVLTEIRANQCLFDGANLTNAQAQRAELTSCLGSKATLEGADFRGARFESSFFGESKAAGLDLTEATLTKSSFAGSDLSRSRFIRATGEGAIFLDTCLDRADFTGASLPDSHFMQATGKKTTFARANLRGSRLNRMKLDHAEFVEANLFAADFSKSELANISFRGSNLYDAKFPQAQIRNCFFTGANLKRALLET